MLPVRLATVSVTFALVLGACHEAPCVSKGAVRERGACVCPEGTHLVETQRGSRCAEDVVLGDGGAESGGATATGAMLDASVEAHQAGGREDASALRPVVVDQPVDAASGAAPGSAVDTAGAAVATTLPPDRARDAGGEPAVGNKPVSDSGSTLPATKEEGADKARVQELAAGLSSTCAIKSTGELFCWGDRKWTSATPVGEISGVAQVAIGDSHTCVRLKSGDVQCWGKNDKMQLGDATTSDSASPVRVPGVSLTRSLMVSRGGTCVLLDTGKVSCWGASGREGESWAPGTLPPSLKMLSRADAFAVGSPSRGGCLLMPGGPKIECWTFGKVGQDVLVEPALKQVVSLAVRGGNVCAVLSSGAVTCLNLEGPTPTWLTGASSVTSAVAVGVGDVHACALLASHEVECWGEGSWGQLGTGDASTSMPGYSPPQLIPELRASLLAVGAGHTCVLTTDEALKCWGANNNGQLGIGDLSTSQRSLPTLVQGL